MNQVKLNLRPLKELQQQMLQVSRRRKLVQVGLFADTANRRAEPGRIEDNPSLGAVHEFGLSFTRKRDRATTTIPRRSFLQMPLSLYLKNELDRIRLSLGWYLTSAKKDGGGAEEFLKRFGQAATDVVDRAFATGGFGHWPALRPETIRRKRSAAILIETAQLRKAVSFRVV